MGKIYTKKNPQRLRKILRIGGLSMCLSGVLFLLYFSFPLISFNLYLRPVFASQGITSPIPKTTILNDASIKSLIQTAANSLSGVDYTNAQNWFPSLQEVQTQAAVTYYTLSVPKLGITEAHVSTINNDLSANLVHYPGTTIPSEKGNAVIFGHSTLPQLYKEGDYNTIFAYAHTLKTGDTLEITIAGQKVVYSVYNITITDPSDTSFFTQNFDDQYLTLVTCTPPGTTWKRLIIKAKKI